MAYKHLNLEDRYYIELSLKNGMNHTDIALHLDRSQPTISREITRNSGLRGYRYQQAHRQANERHRNKAKAIKLTPEVKAKITQYIKNDWSPEQVCGWLKKEEVPENINFTTIIVD